MEEEIVISVKGLSQRYGKGRIIYDNLSFDVPKGRILGLLRNHTIQYGYHYEE